MLFNEPKLLKLIKRRVDVVTARGFSALQRAEIAEILTAAATSSRSRGFSALQRAEIAEMDAAGGRHSARVEFQCSSTSRNC